MPNILGEVLDTQLAGGASASASLIPQAADPATTTNSQLYAKTDKVLYHKDTAGVVTNILAGGQAVANALGGVTTTYPYGLFNGTGPVLLNSGASQNILKGYVARGSGSVIGATFLGAAPNATNGALQVYKNNALFFLAIPSANFPGNNAQAGPMSATFPAGQYPYVKNDYFDVYYTGSGSGLYIGVGITFTEGNAYANVLSTPVSASATIAATDNQRVFLGTAATAYTLTLPATQATQDFYVRVAIVSGAGLIIQAPSGVTIYRGTSASASGGALTLTQIGTYVTLYNPAGTNIWMVRESSAPGSLT